MSDKLANIKGQIKALEHKLGSTKVLLRTSINTIPHPPPQEYSMPIRKPSNPNPIRPESNNNQDSRKSTISKFMKNFQSYDNVQLVKPIYQTM
jgi:hypothetical protein